MDIKKQVCSLVIAKRLKEFGIIQESHYWWDEQGDMLYGYGCDDDTAKEMGCFAAFTGTELGVALPDTFIFPNTDGKVKACRREYAHGNSEKQIGYMQQGVMGGDIYMICSLFAPNEVVGRSEMLVYLLQHKLITAAECNERLKAA